MNDFNLAGSPGQGKKINYQRQYAYTKIVGAHIVVPKPEAPAPATRTVVFKDAEGAGKIPSRSR